MAKLSTDLEDEQHFSPMEEEFFRAGDAISAAASDEPSEVDSAPAAAGVWWRLFKRTPRPETERTFRAEPPPRARPTAETPSADDDDWDWQIALARVRHPKGVP